MFLLNDIASHIDPKVFEKGRKYYASGAVLNFEERLPGNWRVEVLGTDTYLVEVCLDGDSVKSSTCNCPYDLGMHCKHEVAGLLAIADDLVREAYGKSTGQAQKLRRTTPFHELAAQVGTSVGPANLLRFIVLQGEQNPTFRDAFLLHFAKHLPGNPQDNYLRIVRAIIRQAEGAKHYLSQTEAEEVADEFRLLFESELERLGDDGSEQIRQLSSLLLDAITEAEKSAEDYEGYLSMLRNEVEDFRNK